MDKSSQLYIIMKEIEYQYCLYRIDAPENNEDESTIHSLNEPLLKMEKSMFPDRMSFEAVGSRIFMVGGCSHDGNHLTRARDTFIYDTLSNSLVQGPSLTSGKVRPILFVVGSKIFALSRSIHTDDHRKSTKDPKPQFEFLDTDDLEHGWSALPLPRLYVSQGMRKDFCSIESCTASYVGKDDATLGTIFISLQDVGTYAFNVDKKVWNHVSDDSLPFPGHAPLIPPLSNLPSAPSLCIGSNSKSRRYSAFHVRHYANEGDENDLVLQVDEIELDSSPLMSPPLPPTIYHVRPSCGFDHHGRVYYVWSGVDDPEASNTYRGNRYVKVTALQLCTVESTKVKSLKKKKKERKLNEEHAEEEPDDTVKLGLSRGPLLNKCNNTQRKTVMGNDETTKLKMTPTWRKSLFGGPMCNIMEPVSAVFAI